MLYKKPGVLADQLLYRDFNKEAVYKALARKGETLKHLWQKYNAIGVVDGKKPMSYRQYCRRYSEWADSKQLTFHIPVSYTHLARRFLPDDEPSDRKDSHRHLQGSPYGNGQSYCGQELSVRQATT